MEKENWFVPNPYISPCAWCGKLYRQHQDSQAEDAPVPRVPCLLLKSGFVVRPYKKEDSTPHPDSTAMGWEERTLKEWLATDLAKECKPWELSVHNYFAEITRNLLSSQLADVVKMAVGMLEKHERNQDDASWCAVCGSNKTLSDLIEKLHAIKK